MLAGYLRVSTEGQVDGFGLDDQRAQITAWAQSQNLSIDSWHVDPGCSGASLERPALNDVIRLARDGKIHLLVVAKLDRLARDLMAQLWLEKELLKYHCEIFSVAEPLRGQDPSNRLFRQIIGAFAEFERSRISERLQGGARQKAARGGYAGGQPPTGYSARKHSGSLSIDPNAAQLVIRTFRLHSQHPDWSLRTIAHALTQEGFHGPKGGSISAMSVHRILSREDFYRGTYHYADTSTSGEHDPILT